MHTKAFDNCALIINEMGNTVCTASCVSGTGLESAYKYLAGGVFGKLVDNFNFFGDAERGHVCAAIGSYIVSGELAAGDQHHACLYALAPCFVGNAVYGALA